MGAFDTNDGIITIHNPKWDAHETVTVRTIVTVADEIWVKNQFLKIQQTGKKKAARGGIQQTDASVEMQSQLGAANCLWVFRMLKSWTFTKGGQPVPVSLEACKQLRQDYLDYIYEQIMAAQPKDEEEETEQGEDDDDAEDPTLLDASDSIDGEMSNLVEMPSEEPTIRNYLKRF